MTPAARGSERLTAANSGTCQCLSSLMVQDSPACSKARPDRLRFNATPAARFLPFSPRNSPPLRPSHVATQNRSTDPRLPVSKSQFRNQRISTSPSDSASHRHSMRSQPRTQLRFALNRNPTRHMFSGCHQTGRPLRSESDRRRMPVCRRHTISIAGLRLSSHNMSLAPPGFPRLSFLPADTLHRSFPPHNHRRSLIAVRRNRCPAEYNRATQVIRQYTFTLAAPNDHSTSSPRPSAAAVAGVPCPRTAVCSDVSYGRATRCR